MTVVCGDGKATLEVYDNSVYILTLDNAEITKCYQPSSNIYYGVYFDSADLADEFLIMLEGENSITAAVTAGAAYGIRSNVNMTIEGSGSLDVQVKGCTYSVGISSTSNLTVNSGKINVSAAPAKSPYISGDALYVFNDITVNGGSLELYGYNKAISDLYDNFSFAEDMIIKVGESEDGSDAAAWSGSVGGYKYVRIEGTPLGVWVNGEAFTSGNIDYGIECGDGIATLDRSTTPWTLTLENAEIDKGYAHSDYYDAVFANRVINIVLKGNNSIYLYSTSTETRLNGISAIYEYPSGAITKFDMTIGGPGSLDIYISGKYYSSGIYSNILTVNGGTYTMEVYGSSSYSGYAIDALAAPVINSGSLELFGSKAVFLVEPVFGANYDASFRVGSSYSSAQAWDGSTSLAVYKYVKSAENGCGVWANGVQFTQSNSASGIPCGNGKATLDTSTTPYTLTLTNATIDALAVGMLDCGDTAAGGIFTTKDLTIELAGTNTIEVDGSSPAVGGDVDLLRYAFIGSIAGDGADVTITGSGSLYLYGDNAFYLEGNGNHGGDLHICGGSTDAYGEYGAYINGAKGIVYHSGSFSLVNEDEYARWYSGLYVVVADDASPYNMYLYDEAWTRCTLDEFESFNDDNEYYPTGVSFVPKGNIYSVELSGYDVPVVGDTAGDSISALSVPEDANYEIDLENTFWRNVTDNKNMEADDEFEAGKTYLLSVQLISSSSIFSSGASAEVDGSDFDGLVDVGAGGAYCLLEFDDVVIAEAVAVCWYLDAADEIPVAGITIPKGDAFDGPAEPGKDGYKFGGWYTDRALTKPWTPGSVVNEDLSLFPKWISTSITSIEVNGFEVPQAGQTAGELLAKLSVPSGVHYKLYFDPTGTENARTKWFDCTASKYLGADDEFVAGHEYYLWCVIDADSGYAFSGDNIGTFTGAADFVDNDYNRVSVSSDTRYILSSINFTVPNEEAVTRISGNGREATAAEISKETYTSAENVVIASGDDYADALVGVPLASALDAPILLVRKSGLEQNTLDELDRLGAKNIYILGGSFAVSDATQTQLENLGYHVERIAGQTRFGTAVAIAKKMDELYDGVKADTVFFVYSHNYPDALAVSGVAAADNCPILYIGANGQLDADTKAYLDSYGSKPAMYIIGGPGVINAAADTNLKPYEMDGAVERIYGANRYETCIMINEKFSSTFGGENLCIATGTNYPDALAGGVFCAAMHAPLVLVDKTLDPVKNKNITDYISNYDPDNIYIFGGTFAVSQEIEDYLAKK